MVRTGTADKKSLDDMKDFLNKKMYKVELLYQKIRLHLIMFLENLLIWKIMEN